MSKSHLPDSSGQDDWGDANLCPQLGLSPGSSLGCGRPFGCLKSVALPARDVLPCPWGWPQERDVWSSCAVSSLSLEPRHAFHLLVPGVVSESQQPLAWTGCQESGQINRDALARFSSLFSKPRGNPGTAMRPLVPGLISSSLPAHGARLATVPYAVFLTSVPSILIPLSPHQRAT